MDKQITIQAGTASAKGAAEVMRKAAATAAAVVEMLRRYYSAVLEREVMPAQMRVLIEAQAAFLASVMPADMPFAVRVACGVWLIAALRKCRKAMGK